MKIFPSCYKCFTKRLHCSWGAAGDKFNEMQRFCFVQIKYTFPVTFCLSVLLSCICLFSISGFGIKQKRLFSKATSGTEVKNTNCMMGREQWALYVCVYHLFKVYQDCFAIFVFVAAPLLKSFIAKCSSHESTYYSQTDCTFQRRDTNFSVCTFTIKYAERTIVSGLSLASEEKSFFFTQSGQIVLCSSFVHQESRRINNMDDLWCRLE